MILDALILFSWVKEWIGPSSFQQIKSPYFINFLVSLCENYLYLKTNYCV